MRRIGWDTANQARREGSVEVLRRGEPAIAICAAQAVLLVVAFPVCFTSHCGHAGRVRDLPVEPGTGIFRAWPAPLGVLSNPRGGDSPVSPLVGLMALLVALLATIVVLVVVVRIA